MCRESGLELPLSVEAAGAVGLINPTDVGFLVDVTGGSVLRTLWGVGTSPVPFPEGSSVLQAVATVTKRTRAIDRMLRVLRRRTFRAMVRCVIAMFLLPFEPASAARVCGHGKKPCRPAVGG